MGNGGLGRFDGLLVVVRLDCLRMLGRLVRKRGVE